MKYCLISGISRGLGLSLATHFLENNYKTIGIGRNNSNDLVSNKNADNYTFIKVDLYNIYEEILNITNYLNQVKLKDPTEIILINNAATSEHVGTLPNLKDDEIFQTFSLNLISPIILSKLLLKSFINSGTKIKLIHVSSGAAKTFIPGGNLYSISKSALEQFALSIESERKYINVDFDNVIFRPGLMDTNMQAKKRSMDESIIPVVQMYKDFHQKGMLVKPDIVAEIIFKHLVQEKVISGKIYSVEDFLKK